MKTGNENKPAAFKTAAQKLRSQFLVFLFFLAVSASIWMVLKLSDEFTSPVVYRLDYINQPRGKILISASDTTLTLGLGISGFEFIRFKFWEKTPRLIIDLANLPSLADTGSLTTRLPTGYLLRKLSSQGIQNDEIRFASPDTLILEFAPVYRKRLPVVADISYTIRQQFNLYEPLRIIPDSVEIAGVYSDIKLLELVTTKPAVLHDIYHDQTLTLPIQTPRTNYPVSISVNEVAAVFNVEQYTEATIDVPIEINYLKPEYTLRIFPNTVKVTYLVALSDYKRVDPALFRAVVQYGDDKSLLASRLKIEIAYAPDYVEVTRLEPDRVEFIRIKN